MRPTGGPTRWLPNYYAAGAFLCPLDCLPTAACHACPSPWSPCRELLHAPPAQQESANRFPRLADPLTVFFRAAFPMTRVCPMVEPLVMWLMSYAGMRVYWTCLRTAR